ncbi:MAPEG family protein [Massilia sp. W12]|uniref:MAPEG family protein n=1 Tax=Massilia sp. W12 TaxID=3126507 RepID=UPI0030D5A219
MQHAMIYPMAAHVVWCAVLYCALTVARAPAVWGVGRRADGGNPFALWEPRISANLSNQFEWPLLFHIAGVLHIVQPSHTQTALTLAWLFIAGRLAHSAVQICTGNIRLRGAVFSINFLAALGLWLCLLWP